MPALRNEEEAKKPTVETEDRNQAHSEVTKDSTTAQPAPVTERLSEPMEVERNDTRLIDALQPPIDHMNTFGVAFHSTSVRNTDSLIKNGVCPSNELSYAGRGRLSVHFGVLRLETSAIGRPRPECVVMMKKLCWYFVFHRKFLLQYDAMITENGAILVLKIIPFDQIREACGYVSLSGAHATLSETAGSDHVFASLKKVIKLRFPFVETMSCLGSIGWGNGQCRVALAC